jgi:cell wall-associated NlpC family hydrolase
MKCLVSILLLILFASSCKSAKNTTQGSTREATKTEIKKSVYKQANSIVNYAKGYKGVNYKYGGNDKRGIDCSGLIYNSFKAHDIAMPRNTKDLSVTGDWIDIKKVREGDLVFFATKKNSRKINHAGIVTDTQNDDVSFIHSSISKGVMISKISERYWYFAFVQARRYL